MPAGTPNYFPVVNGTPDRYNAPTLSFPVVTGTPDRYSVPTSYPVVTGTPDRYSAPKTFLGSVLGSFIGKSQPSDFKTYDQYSFDKVNDALSYPTTNVANVDPSTNVMDRLSQTAGSILKSMGSIGDGDPQNASFDTSRSTPSAIDPLFMIGAVVAAGALIYFVNKK